jgi:signal transduction histidine kinase
VTHRAVRSACWASCWTRTRAARRAQTQALHEREARRDFLARLGDALRRLADPQAIAFEASRQLAEFVGADRVGYAEDAGDGEMAVIACHHTASAAGMAKLAKTCRVATLGVDHADALRARHTVVRPDIAADPTLDATTRAAHAALQIGASVSVPVLEATRLQATFFIHTRGPRDWTREEVKLFEEVAERLRADLERSRAEQAQRTASAQLEAALASINDAVFITDVSGRFVRVNEAFLTFHRRHDVQECPATPAEWATLVEVSRLDGTPLPLSLWAVPRALRGESGQQLEYRLRRRDTGEQWVGSYSFAPIRGADGGVTGAVVTARDVSELRQLQAQLAAAHAQLQQTLNLQARAREQERVRIARELHDDLQQTLAAVLMEAGLARVALASSGHGIEAAAEAIARIDKLSAGTIASLRRIVHDLRPQVLEDLGLEAALHTLATHFHADSGIECHVEARGLRRADPGHLAQTGTCLYRVAQEALSNVAKHAAARTVRIRLRRGRDGSLGLSIVDNGRGLAAGALERRDTFGLLDMRERLREVGGTLQVRSRAGRGTTIEALIPPTAGR